MVDNVEQAFGGTRPMLSVIENIYSAVSAPELWDSTLRQIANLLGGDSIALFAGAPNAQTPHLLSVSEMDPTAWDQFVQYYAAINPIMQRCEERLDPKSTWFGHSVLTDSELEHTEFYTDFFHPNAMHHSVGMRLQSGGQSSANLSCQRTRAAGSFGADADVILQTLRPHLTQALCLRMHLETMQAQKFGIESALDAYDHAVMGIDSYGHVALCSTHAHTVLAADFGLSIVHGRLVCRDHAQDLWLQEMIQTALRLQEPRLRGASALSRKPKTVAGTRNVLLLHSRTGAQSLHLTILPHRRALHGQSAQLAAMVFLSHSGMKPGSRSATLTALYGLTPTESRITDLLATGLDVAEIGASLALTRETTRFYVKRILAKTGTRRQLDLLRLILSLPSRAEYLPFGR